MGNAGPASSSPRSFSINRAPVLTLWAAVVAERLGYHPDEAATFGKSVAGLNAASKARALGLAKPRERTGPAAKTARARGRTIDVELLGRTFPAHETSNGLRALHDGKPISPESVARYLEGKFGEHLAAARQALTALARSRPPRKLAEEAFALYEAFRPEVPRGTRGWGAKGVFDLGQVARLAGGADRRGSGPAGS